MVVFPEDAPQLAACHLVTFIRRRDRRGRWAGRIFSETDVRVDCAILNDAIGVVRIVGGVKAGLLHAAAEEFDAGSEILRDRRPVLMWPVSSSLGLRIDAELAGVAVVVDVVTAIGGEEVRGRRAAVGIAERLVVAAVSVDNVVVNERAAEAGRGEGMPCVGKIVVEASSGVEGVEGVGLLPGLFAKHRGG